MIQHIILPVSEIHEVMLQGDEGDARISGDNKKIIAIIGDDLHILVGDFKGIETEDVMTIVMRNLMP